MAVQMESSRQAQDADRIRRAVPNKHVLLGIMLLCCCRGWGESDESLMIFNQDAALSISINGAPVITDDGSQPLMASPPVSTLLLSGNNQITVSFHPLQVSPPEKPSLRLVLTQTPDGAPLTQVWELRLPIGQDVSVNPTTVNDGAILAGLFTASTNVLTWADQDGMSIWSMRFSAADAPAGIPSAITMAPSQGVTANVIFANADGSHSVEYDDLDLTPDPVTNEANVDLTAISPSSGEEFLGSDDIDTITVTFPTMGSPVTSSELYLTAAPAVDVDATYSVPLTLSSTKQLAMQEIQATWLPVTDISPSDESDILNLVDNLQNALTSADVAGLQNNAGYFFGIDGRLRGQDPTQYTSQVISMLSAGPFSDPGFQMVPIDSGDLLLQIAPSGRTVHVTRSDGSPAMQSIDTGQGHISMDLYVAVIDTGTSQVWSVAETNDVLH